MKSVLLAILDPAARAESFAKTTKMFATDTLAVFVAGGVVCALAVVCIFYVRRRKRRIIRGEKVFKNSQVFGGHGDESEEIRRRYKKRVRRREHRYRNPTLAETGGLPETRNQSDQDAG